MPVQNVKPSVSGGGSGCYPKPLTFEVVAAHVRRMGLNDRVAERLVAKARAMPAGALPHFVKNINTYIIGVNRDGK